MTIGFRYFLSVTLIILSGLPVIHGRDYDVAPDFILQAKLPDMANPPTYTMYTDLDRLHVGRIDIWYRLRFTDSGEFLSATPVYSTRDDSALIRSTSDPALWSAFRPGSDSAGRTSGYLTRICYRQWVGQCEQTSVPSPFRDSAAPHDVLPELIGSDPAVLPEFFNRPGFSVETKILYYVSEYGDVCAKTVIKSSGWVLFDLFAMEVAEGWHYRPAIYQGQPVGMWMNWIIANNPEQAIDSTSNNN